MSLYVARPDPGRDVTIAAQIAELPHPTTFTGEHASAAVGAGSRLQLSSRAPAFLRMHMSRGVLRVATLGIVDIATLRVAWLLRELVVRAPATVRPDIAALQFIGAVMLGLALFNCYGPGDRRRNPGAIARATALGVGMALWTEMWSGSAAAVLAVVGVWAIAAAMLLVSRRLVNQLVRLVNPAPSHVARAVVIGSAAEAVGLIDHPAIGETRWCHLEAYFEPSSHPEQDVAANLARLIRKQRIDTVIIAGRLDTPAFALVLDAAITSGCHVLSFPRVPPTRNVSPRLIWRDGAPVIEFTRPGTIGTGYMVKRALDIAVAAGALVLLSPLLLAVALLSHLQSDGPVLFRQTRIGRGGRTFRIVKFRTMLRDAEDQRDALQRQSAYADARHFKMASDPRVTALGRVLRRTCIDELPQFWNVLVGDMALVGPRPPLPSEVAAYEAKDYARFDVKPGLTGPWQVNGRHRMCDFEEIVRIETAYIRRWSIWLDLELLLRTVPVVLSRRGAH